MSVQWIRRDHRLDVVLAVCLDAAGNLLVRARSERQLDEAISFNLRLWRRIRALALGSVYWPARDWPEREVLIDVADHVATLLALDASPCVDPRDLAFVAGRNLSLACDLAGGGSPERGRDLLAAEWAAARTPARFETWLLDRLPSVASTV